MRINSTAHRLKRLYSLVFPSHLIVDERGSSLSAITFDDGPCRGNTERILSILDKKNIKATFFVSGYQAEKQTDLLELIYSEGHQLANHGYHHKKVQELGIYEYIAGVEKTQAILQNVAGESLNKVFRPPYGEINLNVCFRLFRLGYQYVLWSYDTLDSYLDTSEKIVKHLHEVIPRANEIFLLHEDYERVSAALPALLSSLENSGHKFGRVDDLYSKSNLARKRPGLLGINI